MHSYKYTILVLLISTIVFGFQQQTKATSPACDQIEAASSVTAPDWVLVLDSALQAGDYISINVTTETGTPTRATLQAPVGTDVATSGVPGTLTYTVTGTGIDQIRVFITGGSAVIDWGCTDAPVTSSSETDTGADNDTTALESPALCTNVLDGGINNAVGQGCVVPVAIHASSGEIIIYVIDPVTGAGNPQTEFADEPNSVRQLLSQGVNPATGQLIRLYLLPAREYSIMSAHASSRPYAFPFTTFLQP